jgi:glycosyltransferase involved in cell wall biosynthesis
VTPESVVNHAPRHSLVIPAYNEAALLPRLLASVAEARVNYQGGPTAIEVVVADNASTDGTAAIAQAAGCKVASVTKRVIAAARNGGAAVATGEILSFIDADSQVHPQTFNAIDRALATGRVVGGATGVRLERWSPGIAAFFLLMAPVAFLTGMDTGVVFCRRSDFLAVGGYDESRRLAEDVAFLRALKRLGSSRGQRLARITEVKAVTSTRKFDRHGDWHVFTQIAPRAVLALLSKRAEDELADRFWYGDR